MATDSEKVTSNSGARIFQDETGWCVEGPNFVDPVFSTFGCGTNPEEAYENWVRDAKKRPEWKGKTIPAFEDFIVEEGDGEAA